jgi:hypothetical protein
MKNLLLALVIICVTLMGCRTTKNPVFGEYEKSSNFSHLNIFIYQDSTFRLIYRNGMLGDTIFGKWIINHKYLILNSYINEFNTKGQVLFNSCDTCGNVIPVQVKDLFTHDGIPARITSIKNNKIIGETDCNLNGSANLFHSSVDSIFVDFLGYEPLSLAINKESDVSILVYLISNEIKRNMINNEKLSCKSKYLKTPEGKLIPRKT